MRLAERILASRFGECGASCCSASAHDCVPGSFAPGQGETARTSRVRIVTALDRTALAIQGPPGAGKTYMRRAVIRALVGRARRSA